MKKKIEDDLYAVLGVDKNSTQEEIKKAYREKAIHLHPDKGGNAEEFTKLGLAYEILSDPTKRKEYDEFGTTSDTSDIQKAAIAHVQSLVVDAVKKRCHDESFMFSRNRNVGIVKSVRDSIKNQIAATKQSITNVEMVIVKLEAQKPKVRIKKNAKRKFDIFSSTVDGLIENSKNMKAQAEAQLEMLEIAAEIVSEYEDVNGDSNIGIDKRIDANIE